MTIHLELCEHGAGTIITNLTDTLTTLHHTMDAMQGYAQELAEEKAELQAELDGMNAGARVDRIMDSSSGMTADEWHAAALSLTAAINTWVADIEARLNAVDKLNSIDGETVRANLTPFINVVKGWENSIDATINISNSSQEDN